MTAPAATSATDHDVAHALAREGARPETAATPVDEEYDLVIVGAGISGLSAAWFHQRRFGNRGRVLILDNSAHVGGATKRVEFEVDGRRLITYGGSAAISNPSTWNSRVVDGLLDELGIDLSRFHHDFYEPDFYAKRGMGHATFFAGPGELILGDPAHAPVEDVAAIVDRFPLDVHDRAALTSLYGGGAAPAPLPPDDGSRRRLLQTTSYDQYLGDSWNAPAGARDFLRRRTIATFGLPADHVPAWDAWHAGMPGFGHLAPSGDSHWAAGSDPDVYHFPDGVAMLPRMLLQRLIPAVSTARAMEEMATARFDETAFDVDASPVRLRLRSTVVEVDDGPGGVEIAYVHDGRVRRVRAARCVWAAWSSMLAHVMPRLDDSRREALRSVVKPPMSYTKVALRNWHAWLDAGVHEMFSPDAFFYRVKLDFAVSMGEHRFAREPDEPIVAHLVHRPLSAERFAHEHDEVRDAQQRLLDTTPEQFAEEVREQLTAALGRSGFDADRDVAAIVPNLWGHAYCPPMNTLYDDDASAFRRRVVAARAPIGRVHIACVDSHRFGAAQVAVDAAERAVNEIPAGGPGEV